MSLPIALGLFSVRDLYQEDLSACLQKVAALGYTGVECFGEPTLPAETVNAALEQSGLTLVGWHLLIEFLEGDAYAKTVAYLHALGLKRAVVPYMPPETFQARESILAFAARIDAVAERLAAEGIALGYHNHEAEFVPLADGTLPWALLMDNSRIFGQLDNGNALASKTPGLDSAELVSRWPGRADTIHGKPYSTKDGFLTMIGRDDVDWPAFMKAAEAAGTQWLIAEFEEEALYSQFEGAELCIQALSKYL